MKTLLAAIAAIGLTFAVAGAASAAGFTLYSPPMYIATGDSAVCQISIVGIKSQTLQIQVIDSSGSVVSDSGTNLVGGGDSTLLSAPGTFQQYRCKITGTGSKGEVRASYCRYSGGSDLTCLPVD